jgi:hypothetical protein
MNHLKILMAAALAVGSVAMVGCKDDGRTVGQKVDDAAAKTGDAAKNAGAAAKDAASSAGDAAKAAKDKLVGNTTPSGSADASGMRGAMEGIVQNALDNNNFKTMTNHLADADKKRLEAAPVDLKDLNGAIDQFKKNWSSKYSDAAFGVQDAEKVYSADFAALTSSPGEAEGKMGKASIKESHGLPALDLNFVSQGGKWRLDVPDSVTGDTLKQKLLTAVQELNADPSKWPADKTEATRLVTHKILSVVSGQDAAKMPGGTQ